MAAQINPGEWFQAAVLAGAMGAIFLMLYFQNRHRPHRPGPAPAEGEGDEDLRELVADLGSLTRRLDGLIADADQRIEELRRLTGAEAAPVEPQEPSRLADPLTQSVYALADAGRNSLQIAQELHEHVGKVELILALRRA